MSKKPSGFSFTPSEVKAVDDRSFANRIRGRSEAIRRLIELGLAADAKAEEDTQ